jgi:hypothetical protein
MMNILERIWHKLDEMFKGKTEGVAVDRAISLNTAMGYAIDQLGVDTYIIDLYLVGQQVVVLYNMDGNLYTAPLVENADRTVTVGTPTPIEITAQSNKVNILRQADGQYRWFALAACSVVNKAGEIDSRELFDDFVDRFNGGQGYVLRFFHDKRMELGVGDYLARSDNVLVASGLIYDNELGRAFVDASQQGRGNWGTSPGFYPDAEPEIVRTNEGIEVPVYKRGYMEEISALPEDCACNFFTRLIAKKEQSMEPRIKDALVTLFGDEAKANEFILTVDETNRAIADGGLLTRETTTEETETVTTEQATEPPPETATIPGEQVEAVAIPELQAAPTTEDVDALKTELSALSAKMTEMSSRMDAMETANQQMMAANQATTQAVEALKLTDEQKQQQWLTDRPANSATQPVTYRPRTDRRSGEEGTKQSLADVAAGTLAKMPK